MIETLLIVASGLLWLLMVTLAGAGHWLAGLYVLLLLLLVVPIVLMQRNATRQAEAE